MSCRPWRFICSTRSTYFLQGCCFTFITLLNWRTLVSAFSGRPTQCLLASVVLTYTVFFSFVQLLYSTRCNYPSIKTHGANSCQLHSWGRLECCIFFLLQPLLNCCHFRCPVQVQSPGALPETYFRNNSLLYLMSQYSLIGQCVYGRGVSYQVLFGEGEMSCTVCLCLLPVRSGEETGKHFLGVPLGCLLSSEVLTSVPYMLFAFPFNSPVLSCISATGILNSRQKMKGISSPILLFPIS